MTDTDSGLTLAERLIALAPAQLSDCKDLSVRGSGLASGVKLGSKLIFDNIEIIDRAIEAGIRRVAVLDELNKLLSEDKQMRLPGFDIALYRARRKKALIAESATSKSQEKNTSVPEVVVIRDGEIKTDVAGVDSKKIRNPGDIRQIMSEFDLLADSDD